MTLSGVVVFYKATDKVGGSLRVPGMTYRPNFWRKAKKPEDIKHPPLPDGRATPTRQGHYRKRGVRRKHEAESVYVANSEPAIWLWEGGRACVTKRDLISGEIPNHGEAGRDTERWYVLPREALLQWQERP